MKIVFINLLLLTFVFVSVAQDNVKVLYGKATYYHKRFEGRKTANGEKFSHKKFTCAHKTLPINTFLKVTNLENDKTIVLRVNDRLPLYSKVLLDLTYIAAKELDFIRKGSADIRVEIMDTSIVHDSLSVLFAEAAKGMKISKKRRIEQFDKLTVSLAEMKKVKNHKTNTPVVLPDSGLIVQQVKKEQHKKQSFIKADSLTNINLANQSNSGYGIQVLSYNSQEKANFTADRLTKQYNESISVKAKEIQGKMYYRVIIGQYASKPELFTLKNKLTKEYKDCYATALD